ncbi:MAG TPA: RNA polymerase sigma factor [Polyangia bacterium]
MHNSRTTTNARELASAAGAVFGSSIKDEASKDHDSKADETLLAEHCAGDRQAFQRLYERLSPDLHGMFLDAVKDAAVADDLVQVTFLKLHVARHRVRPDRPLRPWILKLAMRVKLEHLRRQTSGLPKLDETVFKTNAVVPSPEVADAEGGLTAEQTAQIRAAIAGLPEPQRRVIELHRYQELTFPEIATLVGSTETAVRVRAFRGYERLRRRLGSLMKTFLPSRKSAS